MKSGYTKAYRKEIGGDIWKMSPLYHRVFYYLRQKAEWKVNVFPTSRKFGIALNPGQLITSMSIIAKDVSWNEYGVKKIPNKKTIKKILDWLEFNNMIAVESNRHGTFIIIINWDIYQTGKKEKVTISAPRLGLSSTHALDTPKEDKEVKEVKEKKYKRKIPEVFLLTKELKKHAFKKGIFKNEVEDIFEHFKNHHGAKGTLMLDWDKCWYTWV